MNLRKTALGTLALIAFPLSALAAPLTNTQLLNKAFLNINQRAPNRVEGEMRYDMEIKPVGKGGRDTAMSMNSKIGLRVRAIPNPDPKLSQSEGRLSFELTGGAFSDIFPITWNGSIAGEWKMVDKKIYFRVTNVPPALIDYVKANMEFDPTPLIGIWVGTDLEGSGSFSDDLTREIGFVPGAESIQKLTGVSTADWKQLERIPVFSVSRVEKSWKNSANEEIRRLRFRLNPAFLTAIQNIEIRKLPRDTYRNAEIRSINARYTKLRTELARFTFVANVNVPKMRIERVEFGGSIVEQMKNDCIWNARTSKEDCKLSSIMTIRMNGGMSFLVDDGAPVIPPFPWITPDELGKMIEDMLPKREPLIIEDAG